MYFLSSWHFPKAEPLLKDVSQVSLIFLSFWVFPDVACSGDISP